MQKVANTSRFLIDFSLEQRFVDSERVVITDNSLQSIVLGRLTHSANSQQLFSEIEGRFIRVAEHAYSFRDTEGLAKASRVLMNLPLARARQIGFFYQALILKRAGQIDQAQSRFESIADDGPLAYRARAIQALGALHYDRGQPSEALRFHLEAARTTSGQIDRDPLVALLVQLEISHIQAHVGDHERALAGLEGAASLVRFVAKEHPLYFYLYRNALAVEFAELGRLDEADAACAIALASPFAAAYPEWSETRDEIAAKRQTASQSVVAIHRAPEAERAEPQRNAKPVVRFVSGYQTSAKDFFQRSIFPIPARTTTSAFDTVSILDRVLICIGPRAPPARF